MTIAFVIASDPLAAWGQAAAIILLIELFGFVLIGLALAFGLAFGLTWIRQKTELLKKLRPFVDSVNVTSEAAIQHEPLPAKSPDNKVVRTIAQVPGQVNNVDKKVQQTSDKVAHAVIEFHGRTEMAKTVLKRVFLPGLTRTPQTSEITDPGYEGVTREVVPAESDVLSHGDGYRSTGPEALRNASAR